MSLRFDPLTGWVFDTPNGQGILRDPHGPPSARQLLVLARAGLLELRDEPGEPITKLGAARAVDRAGIASRRAQRTDAEIADEILAVVAECPGANWGPGRPPVARPIASPSTVSGLLGPIGRFLRSTPPCITGAMLTQMLTQMSVGGNDPLEPEAVDPVGDGQLGPAGGLGMGREEGPYLLEHGRALGRGEHRHVADRRHPLDHRR